MFSDWLMDVAGADFLIIDHIDQSAISHTIFYTFITHA